MFHFNLGWGGQNDGYYTVARHQSPSWGFNDSWQEYVIGVSPRKQNLKAEFIIRPKVYFNRSNTFTVEVINNGTLDYSGLYLFANTTGKNPTNLSEAKDKDTETVVSNKGTAVRVKLQAKPTTGSKWYFFVTDKNLNILAKYEVEPETPVNDLWLKQLTLFGSCDQEVHNNQTYQVVYNNRTTVDAEIENNRTAVKNIVERLKDTGWKFASCTYSYIADCRNTEKQVLIDDFVKWQDQIGSLFGEVHILVYPNGNYIYGTDDRAVYFKNRGFRIFFGGGATPYHIYGDNYLFVDRAMMSYTTLNRKAYKDLFDYNEIIDPVRTQNTDKKNT